MSNITAPMDKEQVSHTKNVSAMQNTMAMVLDIEEEMMLWMIRTSYRCGKWHRWFILLDKI